MPLSAAKIRRSKRQNEKHFGVYYKVYEQSGYKYKTTPTIMLKGQWLAELNFQIDDNISVSYEEGKLVITKTELTQTE